MPRNARKMRYPIKRSLKMREQTFIDLQFAADKKGIKYGTLLRIIIEQWLYDHMDRPGKESPAKSKRSQELL